MLSYYRIRQDRSIDDLWFLGKPRDASGYILDPRIFTDGKRVEEVNTPLDISVINPGTIPTVSFGPFDYPVIKSSLGEKVLSIAEDDCQLLDAEISGISDFSVLNATVSLSCIDTDRTIAEKSTDPGRTYRSIKKLKLDQKMIGNHHIFRLNERKVILVVSESIREAIKDDCFGITFDLVT